MIKILVWPMLPSHNLGTPPLLFEMPRSMPHTVRCPTNNRSFAGLFKSKRTLLVPEPCLRHLCLRLVLPLDLRTQTQRLFSVDAVAVSADVVAVSTDAAAMSVGGAAVSVGLEADEAWSEQQSRSMFDTTDDEKNVEMNAKRWKRCRESSADEDYITPNKTAKAIRWAEESNSIETSKNDDAMRMIHLKGSIVINKILLDIMRMDEQIVSIKAHWLPLNMDNSLIREVFSEYGKVVIVNMQKNSHDLVSAYNDIREVHLKTDEFRKQRVPHLLNFSSGQSILVTMAGRVPYCLKCRSVGHKRSRCPTNKKFKSTFCRKPEDGSCRCCCPV